MLNCDLSRFCNSFCLCSTNTDHVRENNLDVYSNSALHENQSSETGEPDSMSGSQAEKMNFNPNDIQDSDSGRDLSEEIVEDSQ